MIRDILPSKFPESGTAARMAMGALGLGAGAYGQELLTGIQPESILAPALLGLSFYTPRGQRIMGALLRRPRSAETAAKLAERVLPAPFAGLAIEAAQ